MSGGGYRKRQKGIKTVSTAPRHHATRRNRPRERAVGWEEKRQKTKPLGRIARPSRMSAAYLLYYYVHLSRMT